VLFPGSKKANREVDHSSQFGVEIKNAWSYTFTSAYAVLAWYAIQQRDKYIFTSNALVSEPEFLTLLIPKPTTEHSPELVPSKSVITIYFPLLHFTI
jgi:hypothetical protein